MADIILMVYVTLGTDQNLKFSLTLLSYILPSLVSFLAASEIFCLFNCDPRRLNSIV